MVRLAIAGNPNFAVSDIEIQRGGRSYTSDTLDMLLSDNPGSELYFITGLDSFLDIQTWNRWERVLALCSFVVLSRPGYRFPDLLKIDFMQTAAAELAALDSGKQHQSVVTTGGFRIYLEKIPLYDISSTDIRTRVKTRRTIKYLLPESVEHYIINHTLYG